MIPAKLAFDPYNLIITGVGGQGNVLASRLLGNLLSQQGFEVTIGETFGASQRGGSVMSHLRISNGGSWSPQIPRGAAHVVISLEPTEAIRVLATYGNPDVHILCNTRPVHSIGVISGELDYPQTDQIKQWVHSLSCKAWFLDATETAMALGNPILANIMMIGALSATQLLPLDRTRFETVLKNSMDAAKVDLNLVAFDKGAQMVEPSTNSGPSAQTGQADGS